MTYFRFFCIDVRKSASKITKNAVVDCLRENGDISIWWRLKGRSFFEVKGDTLAHRLTDIFNTHIHCDRLLNINGKTLAEKVINRGKTRVSQQFWHPMECLECLECVTSLVTKVTQRVFCFQASMSILYCSRHKGLLY